MDFETIKFSSASRPKTGMHKTTVLGRSSRSQNMWSTFMSVTCHTSELPIPILVPSSFPGCSNNLSFRESATTMSMSIADEIKLEICSRKRALSSAFGSGCSSFSNFVFVSIRNLASHEGHNLTTGQLIVTSCIRTRTCT